MGREGGERDIYVPVSFGRLSGGSFSEERGASSSGGVSAEGAIVAVMFVEREEKKVRESAKFVYLRQQTLTAGRARSIFSFTCVAW